MKLRLVACVVAMAAWTGAASAQGAPAQPSPDLETRINICVGGVGSDDATQDDRVKACTAMIEASSAGSQMRSTGYLMRAEAQSMSGRLDQAIRDADMAQEGRPEDATVLSMRCSLRIDANRELDVARRLCDHAVSIEPGSESTSATLALREGAWYRAVTEFTAAIKTASHPMMVPYPTYGRGLAYLALGKTAEAEADLKAGADNAAHYDKLGLTQAAIRARAAQ